MAETGRPTGRSDSTGGPGPESRARSGAGGLASPRGATAADLPVDPEVLLPHREPEDPGRERQGDEDAHGHLIDQRRHASQPEPGDGNRREQGDAECHAAVEPALHQEALEGVVVELAPSLVRHGLPPGLRSAAVPYSIAAAIAGSSRFEWGGSLMTPASLDRPVRVDVITYVPTQYTH